MGSGAHSPSDVQCPLASCFCPNPGRRCMSTTGSTRLTCGRLQICGTGNFVRRCTKIQRGIGPIVLSVATCCSQRIAQTLNQRHIMTHIAGQTPTHHATRVAARRQTNIEHQSQTRLATLETVACLQSCACEKPSLHGQKKDRLTHEMICFATSCIP